MANSESDNDSVETETGVINFPSHSEVKESFFNRQITCLQENMSSQQDITLKKHLISINSEGRRKINNLTTKTIITRRDFLWSHQGTFKIAISNPIQLIDEEINNSNDYHHLASRIPSEIKVIIVKTSNDIDNINTPVNIGGIPEYDLLYREETGRPYFYADLSEYSEEDDESWYVLRNINSIINGSYGSYGSNIDNIDTIDNITHTKIALQLKLVTKVIEGDRSYLMILK